MKILTISPGFARVNYKMKQIDRVISWFPGIWVGTVKFKTTHMYTKNYAGSGSETWNGYGSVYVIFRVLRVYPFWEYRRGGCMYGNLKLCSTVMGSGASGVAADTPGGDLRLPTSGLKFSIHQLRTLNSYVDSLHEDDQKGESST